MTRGAKMTAIVLCLVAGAGVGVSAWIFARTTVNRERIDRQDRLLRRQNRIIVRLRAVQVQADRNTHRIQRLLDLDSSSRPRAGDRRGDGSSTTLPGTLGSSGSVVPTIPSARRAPGRPPGTRPAPRPRPRPGAGGGTGAPRPTPTPAPAPTPATGADVDVPAVPVRVCTPLVRVNCR